MQTVEISLVRADVFSFSLYHSYYCERAAECGCEVKSVLRAFVHQPSGEVGQRYDRIQNPRTVYLSAEAPKIALHPAVLNIPQVAEAQRRGLIEVKVTQPSAPPSTAPSTRGRMKT